MESSSPGPQAHAPQDDSSHHHRLLPVLDEIPLISAAGGLREGGQPYVALKGEQNARVRGREWEVKSLPGAQMGDLLGPHQDCYH